MTYAEMQAEASRIGSTVAAVALTSYRNGDSYVLTLEDIEDVWDLLAAERPVEADMPGIVNDMRDRTISTASPAIPIINPWTGDVSMIMHWDEIVLWAEDGVAQCDIREWLDTARAAYDAGDGKALGRMIIGS